MPKIKEQDFYKFFGTDQIRGGKYERSTGINLFWEIAYAERSLRDKSQWQIYFEIFGDLYGEVKNNKTNMKIAETHLNTAVLAHRQYFSKAVVENAKTQVEIIFRAFDEMAEDGYVGLEPPLDIFYDKDRRQKMFERFFDEAAASVSKTSRIRNTTDLAPYVPIFEDIRSKLEIKDTSKKYDLGFLFTNEYKIPRKRKLTALTYIRLLHFLFGDNSTEDTFKKQFSKAKHVL
jgi:hypothetical protein